MLDIVELKMFDPRIGKEWDIGYQTPGAAAVDLVACVDEPLEVWEGQTVAIPTGIAVHIADPGYCALMLPRGGLGRAGLVLGNLVGLIDSDYQGQMSIVAWNRNVWQNGQKNCIVIRPGDRIAQLMFVPVARPYFRVVEEFSDATERGVGAFSSTGVQSIAKAPA